jgi:hypothetical protein
MFELKTCHLTTSYCVTVRQHLRHGDDWLRENWRLGLGHTEESVVLQICDWHSRIHGPRNVRGALRRRRQRLRFWHVRAENDHQRVPVQRKHGPSSDLQESHQRKFGLAPPICFHRLLYRICDGGPAAAKLNPEGDSVLLFLFFFLLVRRINPAASSCFTTTGRPTAEFRSGGEQRDSRHYRPLQV